LGLLRKNGRIGNIQSTPWQKSISIIIGITPVKEGVFSVAVAIEQKKHIDYQNSGLHIEVNSFKIHYYEEGQGQPLLLVHGLGQSIYTWRNNISDLAQSYRVIAVDMIGSGYSDKPELQYSIRDYAEFIRAFLDALGIEKAHMIGFGAGGMYILEMMALYPERVDKAVLVSPGGVSRGYPLLYRLMKVNLIGEICTFFVNKSSIRKQILEAFFDETNVTEEMVQETYLPLASKEAKNALLSSIRSWDDSFIFENIKDIHHPILLLWGENDKWHPTETGKNLQQLLISSQLVIVRNCGHLVHEEKYREFKREVDSFLAGGKLEKQDAV